VIIEAVSEVAARDFMENDLFAAGRLMRASLHPFRASLIREQERNLSLSDFQSVKSLYGFFLLPEEDDTQMIEKKDWQD
jgi:hypothetical protein